MNWWTDQYSRVNQTTYSTGLAVPLRRWKKKQVSKYQKWLPAYCLQISEREGDLLTAVDLYLKANLAAQAVRILLSNSKLLSKEDLVQKVAIALIRSELFEKVSFMRFFAPLRAFHMRRDATCRDYAASIIRITGVCRCINIYIPMGFFKRHRAICQPFSQAPCLLERRACGQISIIQYEIESKQSVFRIPFLMRE